MTDINRAFPSKYLKASDLGDQAPTVTIQRVASELVGGKDTRLIAYFHGKQKGLVLNKTNAKAIAAIADSPETDDWEGTTVQLYVTQIEFQGEMTDAVRVRVPRRPAAASRPGPADADVPARPPDFAPDPKDPVPF